MTAIKFLKVMALKGFDMSGGIFAELGLMLSGAGGGIKACG